MKIFISFFLIFYIQVLNLNALELKCDFEEVYLNHDIQNGFFLIKGEKLRYQYLKKNLFTIFHNGKNFYLVRNDDKSIYQKITENIEIVKELVILSKLYPNIDNFYKSNDVEIKLELSADGSFYKRISIISDQISLSLYLNNCQNLHIEDNYFNYNPYLDFHTG